jgi:hypothetical protein
MAALGVAMLVGAAPAAALEPGVYVNPTSPAATEYSLPLDSTRTGLSGRPPPLAENSAGPAQPFGVGILPAPEAVSRKPGGRPATLTSKRASSGSAGERSRTPGASTAAPGAQSGTPRGVIAEIHRLTAAAGNDSSTHLLLPLVAGVLLVGVFVGAAFRVPMRGRS